MPSELQYEVFAGTKVSLEQGMRARISIGVAGRYSTMPQTRPGCDISQALLVLRAAPIEGECEKNWGASTNAEFMTRHPTPSGIGESHLRLLLSNEH